MTELKPCPFCGSRDVAVELDEECWTAVFVACLSCNAEGPPVAIGEGSIADAKVQAAELWNRRPSTELNQSWLREAVERVLLNAPQMSEHLRRKLAEHVGLELARAHARARGQARGEVRGTRG